jgi:hypothetical protein
MSLADNRQLVVLAHVDDVAIDLLMAATHCVAVQTVDGWKYVEVRHFIRL